MSNGHAERERADEILNTRAGPAERHTGGRGLSMTPDSRLNRERVRRGHEQIRQAQERESTLSRLSPIQVAPPILTRYWAAFGQTLLEIPWDEVAEIYASLLPVTGELLDFYYLVEGRDLHGRQLDILDRTVSGVSLAIELLIPLSGRIVRAGREALVAARIAIRAGRETSEITQIIRKVASLERAGKFAATSEAFEAARRGESLEARHQRALREFLDAIDGNRRRGTAASATRRVGSTARERGTNRGTSRVLPRSGQSFQQPRRAGAGRRARGRTRQPAAALRGFDLLDPSARSWLLRMLSQDPDRVETAGKLLSRAPSDVIEAINTFWRVEGFNAVVGNWVAGGNMMKGAVFVMRYALAKFADRVGPLMRFEMPSMHPRWQVGGRTVSTAAMRRVDLWVEGIRYELKSVDEIRLALARGTRKKFGQLLLDLIFQQGTELRIRWVFDSTNIHLRREEIVAVFQRVVMESSILRRYPNSRDILNAIDDMIDLWP